MSRRLVGRAWGVGASGRGRRHSARPSTPVRLGAGPVAPRASGRLRGRRRFAGRGAPRLSRGGRGRRGRRRPAGGRVGVFSAGPARGAPGAGWVRQGRRGGPGPGRSGRSVEGPGSGVCTRPTRALSAAKRLRGEGAEPRAGRAGLSTGRRHPGRETRGPFSSRAQTRPARTRGGSRQGPGTHSAGEGRREATAHGSRSRRALETGENHACSGPQSGGCASPTDTRRNAREARTPHAHAQAQAKTHTWRPDESQPWWPDAHPAVQSGSGSYPGFDLALSPLAGATAAPEATFALRLSRVGAPGPLKALRGREAAEVETVHPFHRALAQASPGLHHGPSVDRSSGLSARVALAARDRRKRALRNHSFLGYSPLTVRSRETGVNRLATLGEEGPRCRPWRTGSGGFHRLRPSPSVTDGTRSSVLGDFLK